MCFEGCMPEKIACALRPPLPLPRLLIPKGGMLQDISLELV